MRLRKQKKVVAVTLATAIAVSTISASASAVSYDLANGDVTIDQDEHKGAYSYQGENGNRTYVNEDKDDDGKIIIKQNDKETATSNTVTVKEDVKKTDNADGSEGRDVDIVIDGVNADTSETGKSTVTVGEGADVDLTVKDSTLTTGGNGIDIGKDLDRNDENKDTKVDLTLEDTTTIKLTDKNSAGLDVRQGSDVDLTLKGDNIIDGSAAIDSATKEAESKGKKFTDINANVEGIRVGGETASDSSDAKKDAHLTIKGDKDETADTTEETSGGSLTIQDTTTGMVIAGGSDEKDSSVTITDGADVTIQDTHVSGSTQSGSGVIQHGDLTIEDGSSLTIDKVDNGGSNSKGNGIASWNDIIVKAKSKLNIKGTSNGIYGHQDSDANLTVDDSTLDITDSGAGIRYEGGAADGSHTSAGDITFKNSDVNIAADSIGITTGDHGKSNITFDHTEATITASSSSAIHAGDAVGTNGNLTVTNGSNLDLNGFHGIWAGFDTVMISGHSTVNSTSVAQGIRFLGNKATGLATKLYVTDNSQYNLFGGGDQNWAVDASSNPGALIKIDGNSILLVDHNDSNAGIVLGKNGKLIVDNGTVLVKGNYVDSGSYKGTGILAYGNDASILIKDNSHVESTSITRYPRRTGQKLVVTGGTLTYDYSLANTLWPENAQGNKLTNFLLTKDDAHANFDAFSYNGTTYKYVSDLDKETDKEHLSVWVPAAALEYMLDVDGSHDPEIIGKTLADLQAAGYNFNTKYKTPDGVIVLRDMVVNGHSLNFTKTTDADGNTKLIWGNYEKQADGAPNPYDMVYGTEYEYEGQKYTIVWGFEHKNNADGSTADGLNQNILDAFDADSNVKVTGENITGENADDYTVTIYGALREVVDPTPDPEPTPDPTPDPIPDPDQPDTPVTPEDPTNPPVQDATPDAPAETPVTPENPANPPVQDAAPDAPASTVSTLPKTGVNWIAALAMGLSGLTLMAAGAFTSLFRKSRH